MNTLQKCTKLDILHIAKCFFIAGSKPYDFMSRYFAPWVGIPEDPVTGSAHTVLAPYWAEILGKVG